MSFKSDLSIFWTENAIFIGVYSIFALIVCTVLVGFEFYNRSINVAFSRLMAKAAILMMSVVIFFTVSLYIVNWKSTLFGGEILTNIIVAAIWFILSFLLNKALIIWSGQHFEKRYCYKYFPILVLMSPFIIFITFVFLLGSAWGN